MFLKEMREKKEKSIFQYKRNKFLKNIFNNIGEIYEDDKNITCVVKQELLEKTKKRDFYKLNLYGISDIFYKEMNYFKLNKNVHYIFEGIVFDKPLMIYSHYCDITFKNCVFNNANIKIFYADKITFSDNKYYCDDKVVQDTFLKTNMTEVDELLFIKEKFENGTCSEKKSNGTWEDLLVLKMSDSEDSSKMLEKGHSFEKGKEENKHFGIDVKAKKIIIKDSLVNTGGNCDVTVKAKEVDIDNSTIVGGNIFIKSDYVKNDNSVIEALKIVNVTNDEKNCDLESENSRINGHFVILNGLARQNNDNKNSVESAKKLSKKRMELIGMLAKIRDMCNKDVEERVLEFRTQEEKKNIKMLLKK